MAKKKSNYYGGTNKVGKIAAIVLALAIAVGGVLCCGYASRTDEGWFKNPDLSSWHWSDKSPNDEGSTNVVVTDGGSNKVQLKSAAIAVADFEAYGLNEEETETAYTLTIVKKPEDSVTAKFTWSAEYVNPASAWASGKKVTDYLTVTPAEDNCSAVVACKQAFGEQIRVKVVYNDDSTIFATRMADYVKRIEGITGSGADAWGKFAYGDECDYISPITSQSSGQYSFVYGVGTIEGKFDPLTVSGWYELSEEAYNYLLSAESTSHQYMSQFLAANNNNVDLTKKTVVQKYAPDVDDWFEECQTTSFLNLNGEPLKGFNYYNAAVKEMLINTTNQTRCGFSFTYKYGSYSEVVTVHTAWVSTPADYVIVLNGIDLNGSELIYGFKITD